MSAEALDKKLDDIQDPDSKQLKDSPGEEVEGVEGEDKTATGDETVEKDEKEENLTPEENSDKATDKQLEVQTNSKDGDLVDTNQVDEKSSKDDSELGKDAEKMEEKGSCAKQPEESVKSGKTETADSSVSEPKKEDVVAEKKEEVKPHVSLRSVRTRKNMGLNKDSDYQKVFLSTVKQADAGENGNKSASSEADSLKGRKGRSRKQKEETPPNEVSEEATKKLKLGEHEAVTKEEAPSTRVSTRMTRAKNIKLSQTTEQKSKNGNVPSSESSRVNSPVTALDSIIVVPDSAENSVDILEKDPLANSDEEVGPSPKPMNLQSFSLDYNESATPPPFRSFRLAGP
ncbi:hypothetical protein NQ318_016903 [Aromia moschata]|uniref:Uncharacterized protein n=1 Tax=Aromia moschata TaxID=1265417 RepID=A0AAV8XT92_9CUCU|nr:hypothetical protein NQ318_016903 [Aromia moschata]